MNHPNSTQTLGPMLRAMREGAGLTLAELAARVKVSKSTLSRYETGGITVPHSTLARIVRAVADSIEEARNAA